MVMMTVVVDASSCRVYVGCCADLGVRNSLVNETIGMGWN